LRGLVGITIASAECRKWASVDGTPDHHLKPFVEVGNGRILDDPKSESLIEADIGFGTVSTLQRVFGERPTENQTGKGAALAIQPRYSRRLLTPRLSIHRVSSNATPAAVIKPESRSQKRSNVANGT
jgi:hypothetical protein